VTTGAAEARLDEVLVEEHGAALVISINRPHRRNAVNHAVSVRIAAALDRLDSRDDLAVGILTGTGGTFCAGMDLQAFLDGESPTLPDRGFAGITGRPPAKPLIAAVEGHAVAGGFEIVLACDLIVAATDSSFGVPEVRRGLTPAGGAMFTLPRRIPFHIAMEMVLTGAPVTATRALEFGLVNRLVEPLTALREATALAAGIARNGPLAVAAAKAVLRVSQDWPLAEGFERQRPWTDPVRESEDAREGALAFTEKRDPVWQRR
jgi:enoyl-CoA hydratase